MDNYLKKISAIILTLIFLITLYIGINRVIHISDYKEIRVLEEGLRKKRIELINSDKKDEKIQYQVDRIEIDLQYFRNKVKLF
ncbi:hypothetical protein [Clostridium sp. CF012]|uniref:hypothetical protein n=1 Tax=Clostridium sp. CF012 TaxID=2843319 RepID=UPI001C0C1580|nr:hypothetical protein [Clostridium sp. CF012]MBU3144947.1 hypothetical protein [Clostridium sp. CF012]